MSPLNEGLQEILNFTMKLPREIKKVHIG
jgi:hypothetical protein